MIVAAAAEFAVAEIQEEATRDVVAAVDYVLRTQFESNRCCDNGIQCNSFEFISIRSCTIRLLGR